jgi:TetR/AcrR family transcriptional regulator, tetracycline repressor protein
VDAETITWAALEVLDDLGLDKLSMRAIADRLGVQVGGLYYYLPDKSALLRSMADELCHQALLEFETNGEGASATRLCACVRQVLRGRRDSARVLAAAPMNGSMGALALMNRLIGLLETGMRPAFANIAADTLMSYIGGFVLQEQIDTGTWDPPAPLDELRARFPLVFRGSNDDEATFTTAIAAIFDGFQRTAQTGDHSRARRHDGHRSSLP